MNLALVKLSSLGDVVHALPVAAAVRAGLPRARITWIVERREAPLLRGNRAVDEVWPVDTRGWRRARTPIAAAAALGAIGELRRQLAAARFDVAMDLQGLMKSGLLTAATRAPLRIGFAATLCRERSSALFTNRRVAPPAAARHVVEQCLALLQPLGVLAPSVEFPLPVDGGAEARIDEFFTRAGLAARSRLVVVIPGAGHPEKRWPAERFAAASARLTAEAGASVLVAWGPGERPLAEAIVGAAGSGSTRLAPPTDLPALVALLRRASAVVGADTGPLHVAAALGVPSVGLYGPTLIERNGPYGQLRRGLASPDGRMESLAVGDVVRAVVDALAA